MTEVGEGAGGLTGDAPAVEDLPLRVWATDAEGRLDYLSAPLLRWLGEPAGQERITWARMIHPEDMPRVALAWREATTSGGTFRQHYRVRRRDGRWVWSMSHAIPKRDTSGSIVRWVGTLTDAGGERLADTAPADPSHADLAAKMEEQRARFQAIGNQLPLPVLLLEKRELRVAYGNAAAAHLARRGVEEILGCALVELFPELAGSPSLDALREVAAGRAERRTLLATLADADHRPRLFELTGLPLSTSRGVQGTLVVAQEVTEREQARQAAVAAARRKDEFLAMLAHELRNPLAASSSAVGLLRSPRYAPQHAFALDLLERQLGQLGRLVDDLLDASRIGEGKIRLVRQRVTLRDVVSSAVAVVRRSVEDRGHGLLVDVPDDLVLVADPARLEQVLVNLLLNAARYTPPHGHLALRAWRRDDQIRVEVTDDGHGIAPEMIPRIFELFTQAHDEQEPSASGLGIGLALVKALVELHGGRVEACSDGQGKGSCFSVELPAAPAPEGSRGAPYPTSPEP